MSVFKGNTGDTKTLLPQVDKVRDVFGIQRLILVGDRGMITQTQIDVLRDIEGIDWIAALRPEPKLIKDGAIQMGLFDGAGIYLGVNNLQRSGIVRYLPWYASSGDREVRTKGGIMGTVHQFQ